MADSGCGGCRGCSASSWVTDKYIHIMLLLFPLFTGFWGYNRITDSKFWFFVCATGLWLLLLVFFELFRALRCKRAEKRPLRLTGAHWAVLAFMALCCLSAALSPYGADTLLGAGRYDGLVTLLLYGLIFFGVSFFGAPKRSYIFSLGISTTLCCAVAVLQLAGLNPLWLFPGGVGYFDSGVLYTGEFLGTIGNTNLFGAFLCLGVPLCAAGFITGEKTVDGLLLAPVFFGVGLMLVAGMKGALVGVLAAAVICAPAIINNGRRLRRAFAAATAVTLAVLVALFLSLLLPSGKEPPIWLIVALFAAAGVFMRLSSMEFHIKPKSLLIIFLCISIACVVGFLTAAWFWPGESGAMYELSQLLRGNFDDSFGSSRIRIWKAVLALIPERPLLGGGPDTLALRLDITFTRFVEETGRTLSTYVDNAHNEYLGYLANVGVLGLGAYLAAMAFSVVRWLRTGAASTFAAAFGCALVAYWAQGFFGLGLCITAPVLWIVWGLSAAGGGAIENSTISEVTK